MKLRWILRLHTSLVGSDAHRVSLRRFLLGLLSIATDAREPKTTERTLDLLTESLRDRLGSCWPKFSEWVGFHEQKPNGEHIERTTLLLTPEKSMSNAFLWQVVDDIFVAHLGQQDPTAAPAEAVMQELDFYGVARPLVSLDLKGLLSWCMASTATSYRFQKPAQRQGHHLVL